VQCISYLGLKLLQKQRSFYNIKTGLAAVEIIGRASQIKATVD
jgi:hypothetical protein